MKPEPLLCFPPFRLDVANQRLWREGQEIPLRQKTFAVLRYLVEHPDQLVTKEALLDAVWAGTYVSDVAPGVCIQELRRALGDDRKAPRFIVTMHRRGYRFIAEVVSSQHSVVSKEEEEKQKAEIKRQRAKIETTPPAPSPQRSAPALVGREIELAQLHQWLAKALNGERQIVVVTGEPGIGKTSLVATFLVRLASRHEYEHEHELWIGRGQCIEHCGAGEAYLPVLEALGRLCREPDGEHLIELLSQHAPTWLAQMPALLSATELEALQRRTQGATRERMLRELTEAIEVLTTERPLVLWLEDLHWSDPSTLDWLAFVARRPEGARLLVIGTYRPVEMLTDGHSLKRVTQELLAHHLGKELALGRLSEADVTAYLTLRFPEKVLPTRLGQVLYQRTGGNPLFLASMVQELISRKVILQEEDGRWKFQGNVAELETWTAESVRHLLSRQRERLLPDDQQVLEAASLAGPEFSAAVVAAALDLKVIQVEDHCGRLAEQQQFLRPAGVSEWPDGTRAARYGFLHALYQEFWHERASVGKQQQWHLRMGERLEAAYGKRANEIAVELAMHFEQGRDYRRAVQYLQQAGRNATRRSAYVETIHHLTKGVELLQTLPDTPERTQQELTLRIALGVPLMASKGYTAPEVEQAYTRALELCRQVGEPSQLFSVLLGLSSFYMIRGELQTARDLTEQCLCLAQSMHSSTHLISAHDQLGKILFFLGEFALAQNHTEQGIALYDLQERKPLFSGAVNNPKVSCLGFAARVLWVLGYPDQALQKSQAALTLARGLAHPLSLAFAFHSAAWLYQGSREERLVQEQAEAMTALAREYGIVTQVTRGTILRGWALAEQGKTEEGIWQIQQGLVTSQDRSAELGRLQDLILLAEAYRKAGRAEEGLSVLAEVPDFVEKTKERNYEAELYRLKGELTLQKLSVVSRQLSVTDPRSPTPDPQGEAEACFHKAIAIAQKQQAKSLELRAVMSLVRLRQQQATQEESRNIDHASRNTYHASRSRLDEAHQLLAEIYGWFTEGFDTKDLQEAKALLDSLESSVKTGSRFNS